MRPIVNKINLMKSNPKGVIEFLDKYHTVRANKENTARKAPFSNEIDLQRKIEKNRKLLYLGIIANKLNTMPWIYSGGTEPALL